VLLGKISGLKRRVVDIMSTLDFDGVVCEDESGDTAKFVKMVEGYLETKEDLEEVGNGLPPHLEELVKNAVGLDVQVQVPIQLTFEPPKKSKVGRKKKVVAPAAAGVEGEKLKKVE
jgi:hypothetical protein